MRLGAALICASLATCALGCNRLRLRARRASRAAATAATYLGPVRMVAGSSTLRCASDGTHTRCARALNLGAIGVHIPRQIAAITLDETVQIAVGSRHVCARSRDGLVRCAGDNDLGQCGEAHEPTRADSAGAYTIDLASRSIAVAAGGSFTCALDPAGLVRCWGARHLGQRGVALDAPAYTPVRFEAGTVRAYAIAAGLAHACAIVGETRAVECWGWNRDGQVGSTPTRSEGTEPEREVVDRTAGPLETLRASHGVLTPQRVAGLEHIAALALGAFHSCALRDDRSVYCWGSSEDGQLGARRPLSARGAPTRVDGLERVTALAAGLEHNCALRDDHEMFCWGSNRFRAIDTGPRDARRAPVRVGLASELFSSGLQRCLRDLAGDVWCHGRHELLGEAFRNDALLLRHGPAE